MSQSNTIIYHLEAAECAWDIAPGKTIAAWAFNGQVPGPVLQARKGDTVIVKVRNKLKEPTVVHWHGIRLPAAMDGTDEVQQPILPGTEFEYRFQVPDAGTFWYHSHANETVQMERGLYGALIVTDDADPVTDGERVFVIDDMKLTAKNEFKQPTSLLQRWDERHMGREGDTLLINGKEQPVIDVPAGVQERWRFVNAASARYFRLHLGGRSFRIIGTDGGLIDTPVNATEVLLTPGERVDILAGPFAEGETIALESLPYRRSPGGKGKTLHFGTIRVGRPQLSVAAIPGVLRSIPPLAPQDAAVTRHVRLSVGLSLKDGTNFFVNRKMHAMDAPVTVGELQVWEVFNASFMDHPFHLHGFFFQVLDINGVPPAFRAWKDTVNVAPRARVKIAWLPDNRPGKWMYHCHILEHHAAGMMGHFEVVDPAQPAPAEDHASPHCH